MTGPGKPQLARSLHAWPCELTRVHSLGHECQQQGCEGLGEIVLLHHVIQCHQGAVQVGNGLDLIFTLQGQHTEGELQGSLGGARLSPSSPCTERLTDEVKLSPITKAKAA